MERGREVHRRLPSELRVRPCGVVVELPPQECGSGLGEAGEQRLVQQLVPQAAVEALDEAILHRLAGRDVVPLDPRRASPDQDGVGGQLAAIVAHDHLRPAALCKQPVELASNPHTRQRRVRHQCQALAGAVVDDRQDPEAPAVGHLVGDEVQRPALVRSQRDHHRRPCPDRPLAATSAADRQAFLAVEPEQPLVVDLEAFAPEQHMQTPVAEPSPFPGDGLHALAQ